MNRIEVIIKHSELKREVYRFYLEDAFHLWLDSYWLELRETTRQKFRITDEYYDRLNYRSNSKLTVDQVILLPEIIELAKKQLINQIKVAKWSKR